MGGRYATRRVVLTPGAELAATRMPLTALMEHVHSDGAIPPRRNHFLLMSVCKVPLGAGVLRLLVTGVAVGVFIDRRSVADGVEAMR